MKFFELFTTNNIESIGTYEDLSILDSYDNIPFLWFKLFDKEDIDNIINIEDKYFIYTDINNGMNNLDNVSQIYEEDKLIHTYIYELKSIINQENKEIIYVDVSSLFDSKYDDGLEKLTQYVEGVFYINNNIKEYKYQELITHYDNDINLEEVKKEEPITLEQHFQNVSTSPSKYFKEKKKENMKNYVVDENYTQKIIFLNIFIFIFFSFSNVPLFMVLRSQVFDITNFFALFTSAFMHANIMHLFSNMLSLWIIGTSLENIVGSKKFVKIYALCLILSSLCILLIAPQGTITIGASGAIFGLIGYILMVVYNQREMFHPNQFNSLVLIIVLNFFYTIINPSISLVGHLGGFVCGILIYYLYNARRK
ncbi:MAG: rhomboid family intramembrane serine protease [Mycoplasmatales bacterium]